MRMWREDREDVITTSSRNNVASMRVREDREDREDISLPSTKKREKREVACKARRLPVVWEGPRSQDT